MRQGARGHSCPDRGLKSRGADRLHDTALAKRLHGAIPERSEWICSMLPLSLSTPWGVFLWLSLSIPWGDFFG